MILLRRRYSNNKYSIIQELLKDNRSNEYILKLDRSHLQRHRVNNDSDVSIHSLHSSLIKEIQLASVVMYKESWDRPIHFHDKKTLSVLKFRYGNEELSHYIKKIEDIEICKEVTRYDSQGNPMTTVRFKDGYYEETFN